MTFQKALLRSTAGSVNMSAAVQGFLSVRHNDSFICSSFHLFMMMTVYWHMLSMLGNRKGTN